MGKHLNHCGYPVYAPLLPGHGTSPEALSQVSAQQLLEASRESLKKLSNCSKCVLIGLSMGGLISGLLAEQEEVDGLVLMGTPVYMVDRKIYFSPILKYFKPFIKKNERYNDYPLASTSYDWIPTHGVTQMLKLKCDFIASLNSIYVPTLILQGMQDERVKKESADYIYQGLAADDKSQLMLENSKHIITLDKERHRVFKAVEDFLSKV